MTSRLSFLYHRAIARTIESVYPKIYAVAPARASEFAGTINVSEETFHRDVDGRENTYPVYAAACKYIIVNDERYYQKGSYAYRPDGFFGKWQYHIRFFQHPDGHLEVYCHREISPYYDPLRHYLGSELDPQAGASWMRSQYKRINPTGDHSAPA